MPVNLSALNAAVADLVDQADATETTEDGATAVINSFAAEITKAVTDALTADNAANDASIAAATNAIATVKGRFNASAGKLGDAIANVPKAA